MLSWTLATFGWGPCAARRWRSSGLDGRPAPLAMGDEPPQPDGRRGQVEPARALTHLMRLTHQRHQTLKLGHGGHRQTPGRASVSRAHLVAGLGGVFVAGAT